MKKWRSPVRGTSLFRKLAWALIMAVGLFAIARGASVVSASMGLGSHAAATTPPVHGRMHRPAVFGQVTSVAGNSIAITAPDGTKYPGQCLIEHEVSCPGWLGLPLRHQEGRHHRGARHHLGNHGYRHRRGNPHAPFGREVAIWTNRGRPVTKVNGTSSITVSGFMAGTQTILIDANTKYERDGKAANLSDVTPGSRIAAIGTSTSAGFKATEIDVITPRLAGTVSKVNESSFTLSTIGPMRGAGTAGGAVTVDTSASTTYKNIGGGSASANSLKSGTFVIVAGTLSLTGKTMNADRVTFLPAGLTPGKRSRTAHLRAYLPAHDSRSGRPKRARPLRRNARTRFVLWPQQPDATRPVLASGSPTDQRIRNSLGARASTHDIALLFSFWRIPEGGMRRVLLG